MKDPIRQHLIELLNGKSAHIGLEPALRGFPLNSINTRPENSPHTAWELVEHIRIAQRDIIDYCRDPEHESPDFPDGYWNKSIGSAVDWQASVDAILTDLGGFRDMIADETTELTAPLPANGKHTVLREALILADHNSYHLGQIMLLRRMIESATNQV